MKPAPHTPVNFVKAGGTAFFSAKCIKELSRQGYEMGEFGTYESVRDYIKQCRERRETFDAAVAAGNPNPNAAVVAAHGPPGLSQREYQLGEPWNNGRNPNAFCSGHAMQNATQVTSGSRGVGGFGAGAHDPNAPMAPGESPCFNTVDGHSTNNFPCTAERGGSVNNRGTDSNRNAALEYNHADANGATPGGAYANRPGAAGQAQAESDADQRITSDQQRRRGDRDQPLSDRTRSSGDAASQAASLPATQISPETAATSQAADRARGDQQVDGNSAAECLRNFREMAMAGMRQEFANNAAANDAAANAGGVTGPVSPAQRREAEDARRRASQELDSARELRAEEEARIRGQYPARSRDIRRDLDTSPAMATANADVAAAQARYDAARDRCQAMDARCAAEQGRRIGAGTAESNPRCPGGGTDLPGAARSGSANPTSIF